MKRLELKSLKKCAKQSADFPLVAIGGINSANFLEVLNAGADSVAIISDLLSDAEKIAEKFENDNLKHSKLFANKVKNLACFSRQIK